MRILHTSDWHLGRGFHGFSLRDEQEEMLRSICQTVQQRQVDVVLISGDVYDRALPPEWAVQALESCLVQLVRHGAQVVITSGNHDSAARLGFGRGLMAASGVHIRSSLEDAWTPVELKVGEERLRVFGIPYLDPQLYAAGLGCARASHTELMAEVLRRITELQSDPAVPTVLMAHLFVAQGVASASERSIGVQVPAGESPEHHEETLGGLAVVPLQHFEGFDYVALGHLHGRQRLSTAVRYSGSPLVYSFSEAEQAKGAWLLESRDQHPVAADADAKTSSSGPWRISAVDMRIGRGAVRLSGTLEELLGEQMVQRYQQHFVQARLNDPQRPPQAFRQLQQAYPYLASFSYEGAGQRAGSTYSQRVESAPDDAALIGGFLEHVRQRPASQTEVHAISEALEAVAIQ